MRMGYLIVARLLGRKVWMERIGILYRNCQNHLGSSQQKNGDLAAKSFYNFVLKRSKDSGQWHYSESLMFEKEQDKLLPDGNIVENMSLVDCN